MKRKPCNTFNNLDSDLKVQKSYFCLQLIRKNHTLRKFKQNRQFKHYLMTKWQAHYCIKF
jgi:hypothetical protein